MPATGKRQLIFIGRYILLMLFASVVIDMIHQSKPVLDKKAPIKLAFVKK